MICSVMTKNFQIMIVRQNFGLKNSIIKRNIIEKKIKFNLFFELVPVHRLSKVVQVSVHLPVETRGRHGTGTVSRKICSPRDRVLWVPVPVPDFRDQDRGIPGTLSRVPTPGRNATNGVWPGGRAIEVKGSNKGFHIFHELLGTF